MSDTEAAVKQAEADVELAAALVAVAEPGALVRRLAEFDLALEKLAALKAEAVEEEAPFRGHVTGEHGLCRECGCDMWNAPRVCGEEPEVEQ